MDLRLRLRAVIFDMDGLMFDTERLAQNAWQQAARDFGYEFPSEAFAWIVGLTLADVRRNSQLIFGADFPFDLVYQRRQEYLDNDITTRGIPLKPGLMELLAKVKDAGLARALASSTARRIIDRNLKSAGLDHGYFDVIVGGDEVQNGKPAPDIFLLACERLHVPAESCLVLEDSNAGVQAACDAGMTAIMVPDMLAPTTEARRCAYQILPDLFAVSRLLFPGEA